MKALRFFCLVLAVMMIGMTFVSCGDTKPEETETKPVETVKHDPINVNIIVRDSVNGADKYASDINAGYDFEGSTATPLAILEEFMDFQYDIALTYDADGKLAKVGDLEATTGHLWLWSLPRHPRTRLLPLPWIKILMSIPILPQAIPL